MAHLPSPDLLTSAAGISVTIIGFSATIDIVSKVNSSLEDAHYFKHIALLAVINIVVCLLPLALSSDLFFVSCYIMIFVYLSLLLQAIYQAFWTDIRILYPKVYFASLTASVAVCSLVAFGMYADRAREFYGIGVLWGIILLCIRFFFSCLHSPSGPNWIID